MPFVTEEIYQTIEGGRTIVTSEWPEAEDSHMDEAAEKEMALLVEIIKSVRQTRSEVNTPLSKPIDIKIEVRDDARRTAVETNRHYIERFCNPDTLEIAAEIDKNDDDKTSVITGATVVLPLAGLIDKAQEIERLTREKERLEGELKRVHGKLNNEKFVANAPENVVLEEREKEAKYQAQYDEVSSRLQSLS